MKVYLLVIDAFLRELSVVCNWFVGIYSRVPKTSKLLVTGLALAEWCKSPRDRT